MIAFSSLATVDRSHQDAADDNAKLAPSRESFREEHHTYGSPRARMRCRSGESDTARRSRGGGERLRIDKIEPARSQLGQKATRARCFVAHARPSRVVSLARFPRLLGISLLGSPREAVHCARDPWQKILSEPVKTGLRPLGRTRLRNENEIDRRELGRRTSKDLFQ